MRAETTLNKLADLLGIDKAHVENAQAVKNDPKVQRRRAKQRKAEDKVAAKNRQFDMVEEAQVQEFRAAQGVIYFLQAPKLFTPKICHHCGASFLVSRNAVGYCSYTCIKNSLAALGIDWDKGRDLEALANDPQVFDGNEPIWIKNLDNLQEALQVLVNLAEQHASAQEA